MHRFASQYLSLSNPCVGSERDANEVCSENIVSAVVKVVVNVELFV